MTCTKEGHLGYLPPAHAFVHEIAAEATCSGLLVGRDVRPEQIEQAITDATEAKELDGTKTDECTRMLGILAAAQESLATAS